LNDALLVMYLIGS